MGSEMCIRDRYTSGRKYKGHLDGHKMSKCTLYLRPDRYSGSTQTAVRVLDETGGAGEHITEPASNDLKLDEGG